jgi:DNA-binding GntR family transcriptional regulator
MRSPALAPLQTAARGELAAERLRAAILQGELEPGQALVERDLADRLALSKTPIREALKALSRTGLVTVEPFRGAAVRVVDVELATSIGEVRLLLEPEAIRRAVPRSTGATFAAAGAALDAAESAGARGDYAELCLRNRDFHSILYASCGNDVLCSFLDQVVDLVALVSANHWRMSDAAGRPGWSWRREAREHRSILAAAARRDADVAASRLLAHVEGSHRRVVAALDGA